MQLISDLDPPLQWQGWEVRVGSKQGRSKGVGAEDGFGARSEGLYI